MTKKEKAAVAGSILLFIILICLLVFEIRNPEGGVALLSGLLGSGR